LTQDCQQTEIDLNDLVYAVDKTVLSLDANRNMEERLKKDILYYKKHIFDLTLELHKRRNEVRRIANSSQREKRLSLRCRTLLKEVERTTDKNRYERQRGVYATDMTVSKKRDYHTRELERSRRFEQSMEEALTMKLP
jgi:hypothetical protein